MEERILEKIHEKSKKRGGNSVVPSRNEEDPAKSVNRPNTAATAKP
jgi:hypothetical protein